MVDGLLITRSCKKEIEDFKHDLSEEFEMSDSGNISYFLGIKFYKSGRGLMMDQRIYVGEILKRFEMQDINPTSTPVESRFHYQKTHMKMMSIQCSTEDSMNHLDTFVTQGLI